MRHTIRRLASVIGRLLLAYLLVLSQSVWAAGQEQKAQDNPKPAQKAATQPAAEKPSSAATARKPQRSNVEGEESEGRAAVENPSRDGKHEGIKVHGHWTIEVKNPDGTVVTHREFENSITGAGASLIGNLLQGVYVPAGWVVHVGGTNSSQTPPNQSNPCGPGSFINITNNGTFFANAVNTPFASNFCNLLESPSVSATGLGYCNVTPPLGFCTLTRTPPIGTALGLIGPGQAAIYPAQISISLSGSFTAPNSGYVGTVATEDEVCQSNSNNVSPGLSTVSPSACTAGNSTIATNYFTQAILQAPVYVQAGQLVSVTVNISFS